MKTALFDGTPRGGGVSVLRAVFPLQSFFDNAQLAQAVAAQAANEPIVANGRQVRPNLRGRIVGLHPTSQTPIAIKTLARSGRGANSVFGLTPGQFKKVGDGFEGVEWGLPFGWHGGGVARLVIADDEEPFVGWSQTKVEVLIHRVRVQIIADANPTTTPNVQTATNWPLRFPWPNAFRYNTVTPANPIPQTGSPLIAVEPTRVMLRLRVNNLASPTSMRVIMQGLDNFDVGADGVTVGFTDFSNNDVQWPAIVVGQVSSPFPVLTVTSGLLLEGGDSAVATFTDLKNAALTNQYVDVLRYGKI